MREASRFQLLACAWGHVPAYKLKPGNCVHDRLLHTICTGVHCSHQAERKEKKRLLLLAFSQREAW